MQQAYLILIFHVSLFVPHLCISVIFIGICSFTVLAKIKYIWRTTVPF